MLTPSLLAPLNNPWWPLFFLRATIESNPLSTTPGRPGTYRAPMTAHVGVGTVKPSHLLAAQWHSVFTLISMAFSHTLVVTTLHYSL